MQLDSFMNDGCVAGVNEAPLGIPQRPDDIRELGACALGQLSKARLTLGMVSGRSEYQLPPGSQPCQNVCCLAVSNEAM